MEILPRAGSPRDGSCAWPGLALTEGFEMGSTEEPVSLANTLLVTCVPPRLLEPRTDPVTGARD